MEQKVTEEYFLTKANGVKNILNTKGKYDELFHSFGMNTMKSIDITNVYTVEKNQILLNFE